MEIFRCIFCQDTTCTTDVLQYVIEKVPVLSETWETTKNIENLIIYLKPFTSLQCMTALIGPMVNINIFNQIAHCKSIIHNYKHY